MLTKCSKHLQISYIPFYNWSHLNIHPVLYAHPLSCKKCGLQMQTPAFGSAESPVSKAFLLEMWAHVPVQLIHMPVKVYPVSSCTCSWAVVPTAMPHPASPPAGTGSGVAATCHVWWGGCSLALEVTMPTTLVLLSHPKISSDNHKFSCCFLS